MILFDEDHDRKEAIQSKTIPLDDGLIINKEEAKKDWLIEVVVSPDWRSFFEEYENSEQPFMAEVTITKKTNDPATIVCTVRSIHELNENISVLMDGVLVVKKDDLSDMLLKNLLEEGYQGQSLFQEYKHRKRNRGQAIQGILTNAYEQVKDQGYYTPQDVTKNEDDQNNDH